MEPLAALAFLVAVLGSRLEQESASAAAALWPLIARIDPRRRWSRGGPWPFYWERFYDLFGSRVDTLDWWSDPWMQRGGFDADTDNEDAPAVPWDPDTWSELYGRAMSLLVNEYGDLWLIEALVRWRLSHALRSPDTITRSLAEAALWPPEAPVDIPPSQAPPAPRVDTMLSTMIHGTWAWAGDWWEPGVGFHRFIRDKYRPRLYDGGGPFSWSGAYRPGHRKPAALRFFKWTNDPGGGHLQTVFAHSYGGDIAARAISVHGVPIDEHRCLRVSQDFAEDLCLDR